jgi:hypothetical protein
MNVLNFRLLLLVIEDLADKTRENLDGERSEVLIRARGNQRKFRRNVLPKQFYSVHIYIRDFSQLS